MTRGTVKASSLIPTATHMRVGSPRARGMGRGSTPMLMEELQKEHGSTVRSMENSDTHYKMARSRMKPG